MLEMVDKASNKVEMKEAEKLARRVRTLIDPLTALHSHLNTGED